MPLFLIQFILKTETHKQRSQQSWWSTSNFFYSSLPLRKGISNVVTRKGSNSQIFAPLLLLFLDLGSEIRDPGWIKTGSRIYDKNPGSALTAAFKGGVQDLRGAPEADEPQLPEHHLRHLPALSVH
jgi:hypothetical protein